MNLILSGLKSSKDEKQIKSHLLALKSARLPETLPILLFYMDRPTSLVRIILSALEDLPSAHITDEVQYMLILVEKTISFESPIIQ